jgi:lipoprotein-releasing system permease protein
MFHPLEIYIGLRYLRAKRRNHFISFISLISMAGIALGVTTLITVLSVMNGFETELRERILGMVSHAEIKAYESNFTDWRDVIESASKHPEVVAAAPFIEQETMLQNRRVRGAIVRGISPELEQGVSEIASSIVSGDFSQLNGGEYNILLGTGLAANLGVGLGEKVTVFAPQIRSTPMGAIPPMRRFTVVGLFEVGVHEYDSALAVIHLEDAAKLFRYGESVGGVRLKLNDMFRAYAVARDLASQLEGFYQVRDWSQQHVNFFRAVKTEKTVMFVILSLIVAVAAFNIISTLVMVVTDKQADIAILKTMGASAGRIMRTFMVQGSLIGLIGTLLGVAGGVALASHVDTIVPWIENLVGFDVLPADVYYISELPSELRWEDVTKFAVLSYVMSLISTLYPAWRAAKTHPAEALSYE